MYYYDGGIKLMSGGIYYSHSGDYVELVPYIILIVAIKLLSWWHVLVCW